MITGDPSTYCPYYLRENSRNAKENSPMQELLALALIAESAGATTNPSST